MLLKTKIAAGYIAVVVMMAFIFVTATIHGYNIMIKEHVETTRRFHRITNIAQELSYRTSQNQAAIWAFLVTGKTRYLVAYDENVLPLKTLIKEAREMQRNDRKRLDTINTYESLMVRWQEKIAEPEKSFRRLLDYGSISNEQYVSLLADIDKRGAMIIRDLKTTSEQMLQDAENDMRQKYDSSAQIARYTKAFLFVVTLIATVTVSVFGIFVSKSITSVLYEVVAAARKIATGDFSHRIPVPKKDNELKELAHSYNHMAESLQESIGALQESEKKYATLVENAADGIAILQEDKYVAANRAFLDMTGLSQDDLVGTDFRSVFSPDSAELVGERFAKRIEGKDVPAIYEVQVCKRGGNPRYFEVNAKLMTYRQSPAVLVVFRDVTEKRNYEHDLKRLSDRLVETQEQERKLISQELHDEVGQALSLISVNAVLMEGEERVVPGPTKEKLDRIRQLAGKCLDDIHRISYNLRPFLLDDFGLLPAIRWLIRTFEKNTGIRVDVSINENIPVISKTLELLIYRVIQEGLTNVLKHARAGNVCVSMKQNSSGIELYITDDGIGFDGGRSTHTIFPEKGGLGIFGMRERLAVFNGQLRVDSQLGAGTKVFVHVPLETETPGGIEDGKDQDSYRR